MTYTVTMRTQHVHPPAENLPRRSFRGITTTIAIAGVVCHRYRIGWPHRDIAYRAARRWLNPDDSEDVASEVITRFHRRRCRFAPAFVKAVASRLAERVWKRQNGMVELTPELPAPESLYLEDTVLMREALRSGLLGLTPAQVDAVESVANSEAGEAWAKRTGKTRQSRARLLERAHSTMASHLETEFTQGEPDAGQARLDSTYRPYSGVGTTVMPASPYAQ